MAFGDPDPDPPPELEKSALSRTGDVGPSALTISAKPDLDKMSPDRLRAYLEANPDYVPSQEQHDKAYGAQEARIGVEAHQQAPPQAAPKEKTASVPTGAIFGRTTIFHYNHDGSVDKEDPRGLSFFGYNLDDPSFVGAAVPVDILEVQFGKFTQRLPDGTYAALNTPEAREIIARIKSSHVAINGPNGVLNVPIADIQGSYKNWHRTLDLTLGAWKALGLNDDSYLGYSIVAGDGTVMAAEAGWSDTSPLAKFYQQHRDLATSSPQDLITRNKDFLAPGMPQQDYERAMYSNDGEEALKKWRLAPRDPGVIAQNNPASSYYHLSDSDLVHKVYSDMIGAKEIDPAKVSPSEIRDKLFPHPTAAQSVGSLFEIDSDFYAAMAPRASQLVHQAAAQTYNAAGALGAYLDFISGNRIGRDIYQHFGDQTKSPTLYPDLIGFVRGWLQSAAQNQERLAQEDAARAQKREKTLPGKVGGALSGGLTDIAINFPWMYTAAESKGAAVLGALFSGMSTWGREAHKGQATAFIDAIPQAGMQAAWLYSLNSPIGFWNLLGGSWLGNVAPQLVDAWLKGEKINLVDFGINNIFTITASWLGAKFAPKETSARTGVAGEVVKTEKLSALEAQLPAGYEPRKTFTPGELSKAVGRLPAKATPEELASEAAKIKPPRDIRAEAIGAEIASMTREKKEGNTDKALEHGNRALAMLDNTERQQFARDFIAFTEKLNDNHVTPGKDPKIKLTDTEKRIARGMFGLGEVETLEGRQLDQATEIDKHLHVDELEKDTLVKRPPELDEGAEYHAGASFSPIVRGIRTAVEKAYGSQGMMWVREWLDPAGLGPAARRLEPILSHERTEVETNVAQLNAEIAHKHNMADVVGLRHGDQPRARMSYFASHFSQKVQKAMLIAYEKTGKVGHAVAQEIFDLHKDIYAAVERLEKAFNFNYKARDFYVYHLVKGGPQEQARFETWFNKTLKANPRWTHKRHYSQLEDLLKAGFELETYNPEELLQRRLFQSQLAIAQVKEMRQAERAGIAANTQRKGLPQGVKDWGGAEGELIVRAPNGERYYLKPDAQPSLKNAWDMGNIYSHRFFGDSLRRLMIAKSMAIPLKLYSLTHFLHLGITMHWSAFTNALAQATIHGRFSPQLFWSEFRRAARGGWQLPDEVKAMQGKKVASTLSAQEMQRIDWAHTAGVNFRNPERQQNEFSDFIHQSVNDLTEKLSAAVPRGTTAAKTTAAALHGVIDLFHLGEKILMSLSDWQFHSFIPALKWNHLQLLIDNLRGNHPELFRAGNKARLDIELRKIGKEVENRYGEMFYDNLLWPRTLKQLGTTTLLSMGWNYGGIRMYGGALHDTAALAGKVLEDRKTLSRDDLSERMTFVMSYHAMNLLKSMFVQQSAIALWNYLHPDKRQDPSMKGSILPDSSSDWYFPRTGALDQDGRPKRLRPVEYPSEIAQIGQHIAEHGPIKGILQTLQHKTQPVISTVLEDQTNRNFYGQEVYNPLDVIHVPGIPFPIPNVKQLQDRLTHLGAVGLPIWLQPLIQKTGRQSTWADAAWGFFGYPPASSRTGRTPTQLRILDTSAESRGVHGQLSQQRGSAYDALREALRTKDPSGQKAAEKALSDLGIKPPQIKAAITHFAKNPNETYLERAWKNMQSKDEPGDTHVQILEQATEAERPTLWRLLSPNGQIDALHYMQKHVPEETLKYWQMLAPKQQLEVLRLMRKNKDDLRFFFPRSHASIQDAYARTRVAIA